MTWVCLKCGREYSAMLGDDEVPEICPECGGHIKEREEMTDVCSDCGGEAKFDPKDASEISGDVCDTCVEWVCQNCLD